MNLNGGWIITPPLLKNNLNNIIMKVNYKSVQLGLKSLLLGTLIVASLNTNAQQRAVTLDPKLGALRITDLAGGAINENFIQPGQIIKLVIPVASINQDQPMPKGSCKIKIGLGSKLVVDASQSLAAVNSSNYFTWSAINSGGQSQLTGELNTALPANFQQVEVAFKVVGNQLGHSTITANFLITNHNTTTILSDNDGSNNASFLKYEVTNAVAPTPITTIDDLSKSDCSLKVAFSTDREIDLSKYELEFSKNGTDFVSVFQTNASNLASYIANIAIPVDMQQSAISVRVKSIFNSGRITYSDTKTISGLCTKKLVINMYPNPVKANDDITIKAVEGSFDGKYTLTMVDMSGKTIQVNQMVLNNVFNFKYKVGGIAGGKYLLKISNADGTQAALLQFEKL